MPPRRLGGFITFEGGEGVGKSTQVARLAARIALAGREVVATREPGGSARAEAIRAAILSGGVKRFGPAAEALMFGAARLDHVETLIRPALERGAFVICDRFIDSTRAYQGALDEIDRRLITALERVVVGPDLPDLTLILDLSPAEGLARAIARRAPGEAADRFEGEGSPFHQRLREAFLDIAANEPERCRIVDAAHPADVVAERIWVKVIDRFPALPVLLPSQAGR
ncbi:MAG TPA: dTMP kinase [Lichenihabitans sp.]|jgi:dTMP kinase|nr:dTMP kinase [Lichenihabitans sp.]